MTLSIAQMEAQINHLEASMKQLGPVLIGFLKKNKNKKTRKDGSIYLSKDYHTFVGKGQDGKTVHTRVNEKCLPAVLKRVRAGDAHKKLAAEHAALANRLALATLGKKKDAPSRNPSGKTSTPSPANSTTPRATKTDCPKNSTPSKPTSPKPSALT